MFGQQVKSIRTISDFTSDLRAYILPSFFRCTSLTSPNAPLPMILSVAKFSGLSLVRRKRRYSASARRMLVSFCCLRASEIEGSFMMDSNSRAL